MTNDATDETIEKAARAMVSAWHYAPEGSPDWNAEWNSKKDQYRKQATAAVMVERERCIEIIENYSIGVASAACESAIDDIRFSSPPTNVA